MQGNPNLHKLQFGGLPDMRLDWDEAKFQRTWGQHDMSEEPDIPSPKITGGVGNRRPMDKPDE